MQKKSYLAHVAVFLTLAGALGLFTFILVVHHQAVPERARALRGLPVEAHAGAISR